MPFLLNKGEVYTVLIKYPYVGKIIFCPTNSNFLGSVFNDVVELSLMLITTSNGSLGMLKVSLHLMQTQCTDRNGEIIFETTDSLTLIQ